MYLIHRLKMYKKKIFKIQSNNKIINIKYRLLYREENQEDFKGMGESKFKRINWDGLESSWFSNKLFNKEIIQELEKKFSREKDLIRIKFIEIFNF